MQSIFGTSVHNMKFPKPSVIILSTLVSDKVMDSQSKIGSALFPTAKTSSREIVLSLVLMLIFSVCSLKAG